MITSLPIPNRLAQAVYRKHFGGRLPGYHVWRLVFNIEQLPTADAVFAFVVNDTLVALIGMRKAAARSEVA